MNHIEKTIKWQDLDQFTKSYIESAIWSSTGSDGQPLDDDYDQFDISPETLRKMVNDCTDFQRDNEALLGASGQTSEQQGHNFWLTRNHHGSGFWDEDIGDVGRKLTEMAHRSGSFDLYVGDDGKIHA